ncbi:hypothetical protein [Verrucomicrobium sp. 3C]|uniref:hypothetical protein n=1 Tax=Verrucomicrobium sp. 3C TaxID=1134055 RepID=UPI000363A586|nr:hypothetical protein [Verrucomicrobium sp. 3C]
MKTEQMVTLSGLLALAVMWIVTDLRSGPLAKYREAQAKTASLASKEALAEQVISSWEKDRRTKLSEKLVTMAKAEGIHGLRVDGVREGNSRKRRTASVWVSGPSGAVNDLLDALRSGLAWQKVTAVSAQAKREAVEATIVVEDKL